MSSATVSTSSPAPKAAPAMPKPVVFATSGLGGMIGWCIVHPANTAAGESFAMIFHTLT